MSDNELYELCKEVYEKTQWGNVGEVWFKIDKDADWEIRQDKGYGYGEQQWQIAQFPEIYPLYTSDYLLEKLPRYLRLQRDDMEYPTTFAFKLRASTKPKSTNWRAGYYNTPFKRVLENLSVDIHGKTPLIALLKLTIALADAGELKEWGAPGNTAIEDMPAVMTQTEVDNLHTDEEML